MRIPQLYIDTLLYLSEIEASTFHKFSHLKNCSPPYHYRQLKSYFSSQSWHTSCICKHHAIITFTDWQASCMCNNHAEALTSQWYVSCMRRRHSNSPACLVLARFLQSLFYTSGDAGHRITLLDEIILIMSSDLDVITID